MFTPACFVGVHLSTMNPALARYYNKLQTQPNNRKILEKEGVMIEKVNKCGLTKNNFYDHHPGYDSIDNTESIFVNLFLMQVFRDSPAQMGGLKKYDFVAEIGGQRVEKADDAHVIIDRAMIGEVRVVHGVHVAS
jgi:hypothetical protein